MGNTIVIGAQWGDESKGKDIDILSEDHDVVVRYQGGKNAGHTIVIDNVRYALHLVPSGIFRPKIINVLGNGVVADPWALLAEINDLRQRGVAVNQDNLRVSAGVHLTLPYHCLLDGITGGKVGTTKAGIGQTYTDKVSRDGIRMFDLLDAKTLEDKVRENVSFKNWVLKYPRFHNKKRISASRVYDNLMDVRKELIPFIEMDVGGLVMKHDGSLLFEGAQGTLLDVDVGTYPFVTSSTTTIAGAYSSVGVFVKFDRVIGIAKAYTTRVGEGPFPTELNNKTGNRLREKGKEFGTTTGRPRRCGWFDAPAVEYAIRVNGLTEISLAKLDVLSGEDEIRVCMNYTKRGKILDYFPVRELDKCKPLYVALPGWKRDISNARTIGDLPSKARDYISFIQDALDIPIRRVGVGRNRSQTIEIN